MRWSVRFAIMPTSPSRQEFKHAAHDMPPHTPPPSHFPVLHGAATVFSNPKDGSVCVCVCVCVCACVRARTCSIKTRSPFGKTAHQVYDRRCCSTRQHSITVNRPSGTNPRGERESGFGFRSPSFPLPFWHKCMCIK